MSKAIAIGIAGVAVSFAMLAFGFVAGSRPDLLALAPPVVAGQPSADRDAGDAGDIDRSRIEAIVRDYLITNPEIMVEVQTALEQRGEELQRRAQQETIANASADIFNAEYDGIIGNPEGSTTIVEFYDYNCGFCKRALEDMEALVEQDDDLRFVLKEFPILGPDSRAAHVVSMAFRTLAPEKYGDFHRALLGGEGRATEQSAIDLATSLGVDEAALRAEMQNPAIEEAFRTTYGLADSLSITGTPSYVVGQDVVFGALGQQVLAEYIATARATN